MLKPKALKKGDTAAVVSLSSGTLGEDFCRHYLDLGRQRLKNFGLETVFADNALKGREFVSRHPEARADDLKKVFADSKIRAIICAIGGDDTYRLLPYLMDDADFRRSVTDDPKIFTGFSDTTINHLMFHRLGLTTYYGPNYINDICEMANTMLPYTEAAFEEYLDGGRCREIRPSPVWYEERTEFSASALGTDRVSHAETRGFELINGKNAVFSGELLGGCIDSILDVVTSERYPDMGAVCEKYGILPERGEWHGKIFFAETSEEKPSPERLRKVLLILRERGVFSEVNGVIVGKPQNENYYEEYKAVWREAAGENTPVLYNVNFGHAYPRTVLPYGVKAEADAENQVIRLLDDPVVYSDGGAENE